MKKILLIALVFSITSCKKNHDDVSHIVNVSYPTISFSGSKFYSIGVGDAAPSIEATAYDSVLKESYPVDYDPSVIDANTPGLYVVPMSAKNKYGYIGSDVVFVAVTDIDPSIDLSGTYLRSATGGTPTITKVANGLYKTDDIGGAPTLPITAYFAQLNDSILDVPPQPSEVGTIYAVDAMVGTNSTGDTTITWSVRNIYFGDAPRVFVKQ